MFYDLKLAGDGVGELARREMVAMAMQLGYTGVATSHTVAGVMADSDRCKIAPLELRAILSAGSGVAESARFHRELLQVSNKEPFRQFSRIDVVVDNPSQFNVLNSGNPVLKTYNLVAVRAANQKAFNYCCTQADVDIISIDVTQRLPFKLKMPTLKSAVERGIFFEVSYGRSTFDVKARRDFFTNAQMLQVATRGRNIILSSGACKALEMRGPNDVANMSTLFGLSTESAKNAVSRNCKAALMRAVMRKSTYRNALHISKDHPSVTNAVNSDDVFNVPLDWDPLSLGGASSDFIPMGVSSDSQANSTGFKTGEDMQSAERPLGKDITFNSQGNNESPSGSETGLDLEGSKETPDEKIVHHHVHLAQAVPGLATSSTKAIASGKSEILQHTPRTPVEKEGRGKRKSMDKSSGEKARRKKSKKRKRTA